MSNEALGPRRFPRRAYLVAFIAVVILAIAPVVIAVGSGQLAASYGCHVDEGSIHPCIIGGQDYGELFYTLGVLGWLMLFTIPLGLLALVALAVAMAVHRRVHRGRSGA
jgi:uncharacterized membrane protein YhaH (DUF805 family)